MCLTSYFPALGPNFYFKMESAKETVTGKKGDPRQWEKMFSNHRSDRGTISKQTGNPTAKAHASPTQRSEYWAGGKQVWG